jgi:hypothetical protein
VAIRVMIDDPAQEEAMTKELRDTFTVVYHGKDELKNMPRKRAV